MLGHARRGGRMSTAAAKPWSYRAAVAESDLPAGTKLVLLVLSLRVNDMGDPTWPSYNTIARDASISRNSAIKHVANAVAHGWISRERRYNAQLRKNDSNAYRLQTPDKSFVSDAKPAEFEAVDNSGGANSALPQNASNEASGGANSALGWSNDCTGVVQNLDPNTSNEYVQGIGKPQPPSSPAAPAKGGGGDPKPEKPQPKDRFPADFKEFWAAFPRKQGKDEAHRKWEKAIKMIGGDRAEAIATILAGAHRYRQQCEAAAMEHGKIKMAEGWLNSGRWDDEEPTESESGVQVDWWLNFPGVEAKAKALNMPPRPPEESPATYRLKVLVAAGPGKWQDAEIAKAERENNVGYAAHLKQIFGYGDITPPDSVQNPAPTPVPRAVTAAKTTPPPEFKQALAHLKTGKPG
jgi:hypothetical protein